MKNDNVLHVAIFPWLAIGHLIPFSRLAINLAQRGLKVSFLSTPRNLTRITKIPSHLSPFINLVSFPLPHISGLPDYAEASSDVPYNNQQLLKKAFDSLESPLSRFLQDSTPDWIIYDYTSHWLPPLAAQFGISSVFFSPFAAAFLAFLGPPSALLESGNSRLKIEDFTKPPDWFPPESNLVFRFHEIERSLAGAIGNESGTSDPIRFGTAIQGSDIVIIRSSIELEPEWFDLIAKLYQKPILPLGFLPPTIEDSDELSGEIKEWLDNQSSNSVLYVAFGTEAALSEDDVSELALGLEKSGIPFIWLMRNSLRNESEMLPLGFKERMKDRGKIYEGWISQVKIMSHDSIGGCLIHCGWNSVIEGLGFGRVLILFPVLNDQGLNARLLEERKLGIEIERNQRDGSFTRDSVSETVRLAMVESSGERLREKAREIKGLFGDRDKNDRHVDKFVGFLQAKRNKG